MILRRIPMLPTMINLDSYHHNQIWWNTISLPIVSYYWFLSYHYLTKLHNTNAPYVCLYVLINYTITGSDHGLCCLYYLIIWTVYEKISTGYVGAIFSGILIEDLYWRKSLFKCHLPFCFGRNVSTSQRARFMGPTSGPPGCCRSQMGPMLAPWTLLSGIFTLCILLCGSQSGSVGSCCIFSNEYFLSRVRNINVV